MCLAWERTCTGFLWESPKKRDHLEDQSVNERMGSEWILGRLAGGGSETRWLRIVADGGLLQIR
jgi:hypothetical protein